MPAQACLCLHASCSPLRGVSEMRHSISAKFQSVSQRVVLDTTHCEWRVRMDPVLCLPSSASLESLGLHRAEAV